MIEVTHLQKRFGQLLAVDDISFRVVPGEILGFLGPNGAGKSTTMKMITGFIAPTMGKVSIWGCDIETDTLAAQRQIGYLPEGTPAYEEMTPRSFLGFIAEVRGYGKSERLERISSVSDVMGLQPVLDQRIETLSKGFKRRVGLAQAIIHDPNVLVLDEPTDGLDPNQKYQVREMIRGLSRDKIVIISTHILEEVTSVCTRAVIISNGRIVSDCTPAELEKQSRFHQAVTLKIGNQTDLSMISGKLKNLEVVASVEESEMELLVIPERKDGSLLPVIANIVREEDWQLTGLFQEKGRLDEVFRSITEEASDVRR
jgi:gliding motility-associated transport system ATP-binding protein